MKSLLRQKRLKLLMENKELACAENCSGHGECFNGTCFCEIQFIGDECRSTNTSYFATFASVFFLVALICLVQLIMSIFAEWQRMKAPSLLRACRITTQKLLYFVVFLASLIRGTYFTSPETFDDGWSRGLLSAYYPLLMSGSSLIVCFWAEIFHLRDLRWKQRQFLSKSFLGFVTFNVIAYSLLLAEFAAVHFFNGRPELRGFYSLIFNVCYAVLLFIVVIFFLIYGVEVFFKLDFLVRTVGLSLATGESQTQVRGGFLIDENIPNRLDETQTLFKNGQMFKRRNAVNTSQLHQSRLGLLSQAIMMLAIILCLCSESLGEYLQIKVPVHRKNWLNLVFRTVEIGVALWFPCVLWNCMSPEQLWILNPKRLLKTRDFELTRCRTTEDDNQRESGGDCSTSRDTEEDCWICYDPERKDAGPLIHPCDCRGDVRTVHHDCLLKWLLESPLRRECRVCKMDYQLTRDKSSALAAWSLISAQDWVTLSVLAFIIIASLLSACLTVNLVKYALIKSVAVGSALLIIYVCVKILCQKQIEAYQKAKISTLRIENNLSTISETLPETRTSAESSSSGSRIAVL